MRLQLDCRAKIIMKTITKNKDFKKIPLDKEIKVYIKNPFVDADDVFTEIAKLKKLDPKTNYGQEYYWQLVSHDHFEEEERLIPQSFDVMSWEEK